MLAKKNAIAGYGVAITLLAGVALAGVLAARAGETISPSELATRIKGGRAPLILDVRTSAEYTTSHIPGAVNIPHTELRARLEELFSHRDAEVVVHCERGPRAGIAQTILSKGGFTRTVELEGHMSRWRAGGFPLEYDP